MIGEIEGALIYSPKGKRMGCDMDEHGVVHWFEIITPFEAWFLNCLPDMEIREVVKI